MSEVTQEERLKRIAEIDTMFEEAESWGSWMVMCANEREDLVNLLNMAGHSIEHKHQVRLSNGESTD